MRTLLSRILAFAAIPAISLQLTGCGSDTAPAAAIPRVKCFVVGERAVGQIRKISGRVVAGSSSPLSFGVGGTVEGVNVLQGVGVREGEVLATLDPTPLRLAAETARSEVSTARAKLVEAEQSYDRVSKMFAKQAASRIELDKATTERAAATERLRAAKSDQERAERDLGRARLVAPFSGTIARRSVDPFQEVAATAEMFVLESANVLKVEVLVPETLIRDVDHGQVVQVTFPTLEQAAVSGTVSSIGSRAEAGNAFPVKIELASSGAPLLPGMTASVEFNFDGAVKDRTAYLIPISAVAIEAGLRRASDRAKERSPDDPVPVFVVDKSSSKLEVKNIRVGDLRGNQLEVFEGLEPGDQVVSAGVAFLREGMEVKIWSPERGLADG